MRLGKTITGAASVAALALLVSGSSWAQAPTPQSQARQASAAAQHDTNPSQAKQQKAAPGTAPAASDSEPADGSQAAASRRDPFQSLLDMQNKTGGPSNLPAGKAGLIISTIRIDGTVKADNGMIAVVSNPQDRVYFIHEGDRLYDGQVEKIGLDGVVFRQVSKDAFGKPVEREVTKRLYASAGEQQ
jgi:Tfp pilus assembly protein PilP